MIFIDKFLNLKLKTMINCKKLVMLLFIGLLSKPFFSQIIVKDRFDRTLNDYQITLVDWQGHLHNPYIAVNLQAPANVNFPLEVFLTATGSNRLLLNMPSINDAQGASKTIVFQNSSSVVEVLLEIAPDRAGGFGEIENYDFNMRYGNVNQYIPIRVIDQDEDFEPLIPVTFDYSHDNLTNRYFTDTEKFPGYRECFEAAAKDWMYFFEYQNFDEVPVGGAYMNLAGDNWNDNRVNAYNTTAYKGHYVWARGISGGVWSTGYASPWHHTINGALTEGPLPSSTALMLHLNTPEGANVDFNNTEYHKNESIYGLLMHEFSHSIAFSSGYEGMNQIVRNGPAGIDNVNKYQGDEAWNVDGNGYHVGGIDRISGQTGGFVSLFPVRMWMINKLSLLIAENVGWKLREDITSFMAPKILSENNLPEGTQDSGYDFALEAEGGIPFYDWNVVNGALPNGLILDRFTGKITGVIDSNAPVGDYNFTVKLSDYDELAEQPTKQFTITVAEICSVVTDVTFTDLTETSVKVNWINNTNGDRRYIAYKVQATNDWQYINENAILENSYVLTNLQSATLYQIHVTKICPNNEFKGTAGDFIETLSDVTLSNNEVLDKDVANEYSLYPNPASSSFNISGNAAKDISVSVFDIAGNLIFKTTSKTIDIQNYSQGMYFVKILELDSGYTAVKKILKQ